MNNVYPIDEEVREEPQLASCFCRELDPRKRGSHDPRVLHRKDLAISQKRLIEYFDAPETPRYRDNQPKLEYKGREEQGRSPLENTTPIPVEQFGKHIRYGRN